MMSKYSTADCAHSHISFITTRRTAAVTCLLWHYMHNLCMLLMLQASVAFAGKKAVHLHDFCIFDGATM